jgi:hypothetical protein
MGFSWRRPAAAGMVLVTALALAGPARARSDAYQCKSRFSKFVDGAWHKVRVCPDWSPSGSIPVQLHLSGDSGEVGSIDPSGDDWYECGYKGNPYVLTAGVSNEWWARTMADNGAWGWVNQTYFLGGENDEPDGTLEVCPGPIRT